MRDDLSPTARALQALEAIQNTPGITAERLGRRLGVSDRAARRYVAILREAGVPIDAVSGPRGGYRIGRGLRLPPLMLTAAEATGLVMAVLEGHPGAADADDLVGGGLAKILRALPRQVAEPIRLRRGPAKAPAAVRHETVTELIAACEATRTLELGYQAGGGGPERTMRVDPWAVVLRHSRWYLLAWSHQADAVRVLRVDRVTAVLSTPRTFTPPPDLDALRTLEEHLSQHWTHEVDVLLHAPLTEAARWLPRSLGRIEADGDDRTRLRATTDNPRWYARQLAALPMLFEVVGGDDLRAAVVALSEQLARAAPHNGVRGRGPGRRRP
ncbi:helix-turn-helix transcriptional regulator [Asanoa iriomotensis]|uniref:Transcriptional regulator n=1 Tax=Asanoa iriomotensis TaxID=234613 RepID=A0ABQ4C641_9ACTN|nr:WYL domain-containing protein [Asanoa iriomotensis]GIF58235.1 transcriptional regulator [Asanoa iriomotensis]